MKSSKLLMIALAIIAGSVVLFFTLSIVLSLLSYLIIGGIVLAIGVGAYKYFGKPRAPELEQKDSFNVIADAEKQMFETDNLLDEYKQKLLLPEKRN